MQKHVMLWCLLHPQAPKVDLLFAAYNTTNTGLGLTAHTLPVVSDDHIAMTGLVTGMSTPSILSGPLVRRFACLGGLQKLSTAVQYCSVGLRRDTECGAEDECGQWLGQ